MSLGPLWKGFLFVSCQFQRLDNPLPGILGLDHLIHHLGRPTAGRFKDVQFFPGPVQIALIGILLDPFSIDFR